MKDVMWFKHDVNARNDVRIVKLRSKLGWAGYGFYFSLVEIMGESHGYKIVDDGELPETVACLLGIDYKLAGQLLEITIATGLFKKKDGFLYSDSLLRRMNEWIEKSKTYKKNALKRWESTNENNAMAMQLHSNGIPIGNADKNRIDKNIKEKKIRGFIKPTLEQIESYCKERNNGINPKKFFDSNEAKGWVVGTNRTPMKNWKAAIHTWENNNYDRGNGGAQVQTGKYEGFGRKI